MNHTHDSHPKFPQAPILPKDYECAATYTIKAGDTLYSIAQYYGVSVAQLMQVNRIMNPYCLRIGQQLCIPGHVQEGHTCHGMTYTFMEGDTLYSIGHRFQVSMEELLAENPGLDPYNLRVGMQICIPDKSEIMVPDRVCPKEAYPTGTAVLPPMNEPYLAVQNMTRPQNTQMQECQGEWYTIREGDNFYQLARRFNINLSDLLDANSDMDPYHLQVGSKVCIPLPMEESPLGPPVRPPQAPQIPMPEMPQMPMPQMPMPQMPRMQIPQIPMPEMSTPQQAMPTGGTMHHRRPDMMVPPCEGLLYTVSPGDTLYMIAKKYSISLHDLMNANPNLDPYNLRVGMKLCIPVPRHLPSTPMEEHMPGCYYVHIGDTFDHICRRFHVLPNNMMKVNPTLTIKDFSCPGTKVCIPK